MKKPYFLLGSLASTVFAVGVFMLPQKMETKRVYTTQSYEELNENPSSWTEAQQYYKQLYADPTTGEINPEFYENAYQEALLLNQNKTGGFTFASEGPDNVGGRTRGIIVDINNDDVVYAGGVDGGMFKSYDGGNWWVKLGSWDDAVFNTGTVSISTLAMSSNGTLYVGTGGASYEGGLNGGGSGVQDGEGVWYSEDGGNTWYQIMATAGQSINKIVADKTQNDVIYVTGTGSLDRYVNKNWDGSLGSGIAGTAGDVKVSPDGQHILATTFSKAFVSNDAGATFTEITGNGATNIPTGGARMECAMSYQLNDVGTWSMWLVQASTSGTMNGVWYSENHGADWYQVAPASTPGWQPCISAAGQCGYDMVIDGVPGYPHDCIFGGIDTYRWSKTPGTVASDGDGQWNQLSFWGYPQAHPQYVHADIHRFTWNAAGQLYIGSDGGVSISASNQTQFFTAANKGYNVTQFYAMAFGSKGEVMGGTQDNGTQYNDHTGASWLEFQEVLDGDGFECEISYLHGDAMIGSLYYTDIQRSNNKGVSWQDAHPPCPPGTVSNSCAGFYTTIRLFEDPNDLNTQDSIEFIPDSSMYIGDVAEYKSRTLDLDLNWTLIQDLIVDYDTIFITNDTILPWMDTMYAGDTLLINGVSRDTIMLPDYKQSLFVAQGDGGVYITRDMLRFSRNIEWWKVSDMQNASAFAFSRDDEGGNWLWMGNAGGTLQRLGGLDSCYTHESCYFDSIGTPGYKANLSSVSASGVGIIKDIAVDPQNADRVVIARAGSSGGVYITNNGTSANPTFSALPGLPPGPKFAVEIIQNNNGDDIIMVGTEYGVYSSTNGGSWIGHNEEIGLVPVFDIRQQWRDWNDGVFNPYAVYLATHGRGIWRSNDVLGTSEENAITISEDKLSDVGVYPNPLRESGNISFELLTAGEVNIEIYDLQGKRLNAMNYPFLTQGRHSVPFETNEYDAGTYLVLIKSGEAKQVTKFIKY